MYTLKIGQFNDFIPEICLNWPFLYQAIDIYIHIHRNASEN